MNRNLLKRLPHKIRFSLGIIKNYKNWYLGFLDYFGFIKEDKRIIYKLKNNLKYLVRAKTSDFGILNEVYVVKEYHKLLYYIKKNSIVIDIGGHIGAFSVFAAKQKENVKVYSYEPFKDNFNLLKKNIELNNLGGKIFPFNLGVSKTKGEREFTIAENNTGGHGFHTVGDKKIKVKTISLKDIFVNNGIKECDFLKMDCEGAEYEIICNSQKKYLKKIKSITMEYHENGDIIALKKFLEKNGFKVSLVELGEGMLYAENKNFKEAY